jgi:peptidoglycan/xylan/chitin deacetylase (PgdA/CDA1 family)
MAAGGADFGSHTHSHCNLAAEGPSQQTAELLLSKEALESHLRRPVRLFAYPYGRKEHMSETSRCSIVQSGYECAISAQHGLATSRSDRFCLPRLGYASHMWAFAGDICYQFVKQAVKDALTRRHTAPKAKELHG